MAERGESPGGRRALAATSREKGAAFRHHCRQGLSRQELVGRGRGAALQPTSKAGLHHNVLRKELTVAMGMPEEEPGVTERKTGRKGGRGGIA